jgi:hypothetical protein
MDPNNTTQPTASAPTAPSAVPAQPATAPQPQAPSAAPAPAGAPSEQSGSGGGKKKLIVVLLFVVILLILAAVAYFYYSSTKNKSAANETSYVAPSTAPTVTAAPTQNPNAITDESQLDQVVNDIDSASDEANMTKDATSLKTDSNF